MIPVDGVRPLRVGVYTVDSNELEYNKLSFCQKHSLEERKAMVERTRVLNPGWYCVVIHLAPTVARELARHVANPGKAYARLIMPPESPMSTLVLHARRLFKAELPDNSGVFIYVCVDKAVTRIVSLQAKLEEYIEKARGADGIIHFVVTVEAVFG